MHPRALLSLPAVAGLVLSSIGFSASQARFVLLEERKERDGYTAVVSFQPEWDFAEAAAADRRIEIPDDLEFPELLTGLAPERDVRDFATSSFLLGLPEHRELALGEWSVEPLSATLPDGTTLDGFDASASVTILNGTVGTVRGLQIIVDPTLAVDGARPSELTLRVTGPGGSGLPKAAGAALDEKDTRAVTSLFLNTVTHAEVPSSLIDPAAKDSIPPLPMPPGEFRLGYTDGEKVFRLPLEELGLTAADVPNLTLKHHTELLPVDDFDPEDPEYEVHPIILSIGGNETDGFWFYAPRRHTLSDRSDSVFVSLSDETKSPLIQSRPAFPVDGDPEEAVPPPSGEQPVWREKIFEFRRVYQRAMPTPIGERFAAHTNSQGSTRSVTLPLRGKLTDLNVVLTPVLVGVTTVPSYDPDHYADFTLEGIALPRVSWKGRTVYQPNLPVTLASTPPEDSLLLDHFIPTDTPPVAEGGFGDFQNLTDVGLRYESLPRIGDAATYLLEIPVPEANSWRALTVGGFPAGTALGDVFLLDVTTPRAPVELTDVHGFTGGDGELAIAFAAEPGRTRYLVGIRPAVDTPPVVTESELLPPMPGPDTRLGSIFVREASLAEALQPLVEAHGSGSMELLPQAAYNAFNGGQESPQAIRDALSHYVLNAPYRLPFPRVLLVGHGTLDPRDYLGLQSGAQIPVFREPSAPDGAIRIETPVDMPYGRFFSDSVLIGAVVARLPVRTPPELEIVLARQAAYNEAVADLSRMDRTGIFLNDYDPEIMADAAVWPDLWDATGKPGVRIDFPSGSNGSAQRTQVAGIVSNEESGGAAFLLYMGHGNNDRWGSNGNLLRTSHVGTLDTEGRWPFVATFTCLSAYYAFPTPQFGVSMAETWMLTPERGAIATLAPASIDFYTEQKLFAMEQMGVMGLDDAARPEAWGGIFLEGANNYLARFPGLQRSAANFIYFGDPSAHATLTELPEPTRLNAWSIW